MQVAALRKSVWAGSNIVFSDVSTEIEPEFQKWIADNLHSRALERKHWASIAYNGSTPFQRTPIGFGAVLSSSRNTENLFTFLKTETPGADSRVDIVESADFMQWTIPKVGQPPVLVFCGIIGVFALGVGPALLWYTGNVRKRPIWLLFLFPLIAAVMTGSIFAYGVLHDGFDTYARIRFFDGRRFEERRGIAQSRQAYFSSFPPEQIDFDKESEVFQFSSDGYQFQVLLE